MTKVTLVYVDNEEGLYIDGKFHDWSYCFDHEEVMKAAGCSDFEFTELDADDDWWYDEANQEWPDDLDDVVFFDV